MKPLYTIEKQWTTKAGYEATVLLIHEPAVRCGYVAIPDKHPLDKQGYLDNKTVRELDVHGGISFAYINEDLSPDWLLGFDCGHIWDKPDIEAVKALGYEPNKTFTNIQTDSDMPIRTLDFCIEQCEHLAKQLKEIQDNVPKTTEHTD